MNFTIFDVRGLLVAVVACGIVVVLPGLALARLFAFGRRADGPVDVPTGVVVGLAVLPLLDSMATRFVGLGWALALTLLLAGAALGDPATRRLARPHGTALALFAAWLAVLVIEWVDVDGGHTLLQPLTAVDTVKHAATAQAVFDSGAPPRDAFYLRPQPASYYYYFYTVAAVVMRACAGLVDARSAVGGLACWTGVGAFGLLRLAIARAGLEPAGPSSRLTLIVAAVLAASGVDILAVVFIAWRTGLWHADPVQWNEQVTGWIESLLWVPHHVTGLIASTVGLAAVAGCAAPNDRGTVVGLARVRAVALAALCFASALGLSVWVTLALVTTSAVWVMVLLVERRWRLAGSLVGAGVLSIVLALPQLADLHAGRAGSTESPIVLTVRYFAPVQALLPEQPWNAMARLVLLPVNYLIAFGALGVGAILFWRRARPAAFVRSEFARVLTISAAVGLLLGGFLQSTLFNNDLGWRVTMFPVLAATVWTIVVIEGALARVADTGGAPRVGRQPWRSVPAPLSAVLLVGYATTGYLLFAMRAYQVLPMAPTLRAMADGGATARGLRTAYAWSNANLPASAILQHDPARRRSFAFGLYSRNPVALSDDFGSLYGADPDAVEARMRALVPVFQTALPPATVRATAAAAGIDDLVVTADDPVWSQPGSFVWTAPPVYASNNVRIIPVAALKDAAP